MAHESNLHSNPEAQTPGAPLAVETIGYVQDAAWVPSDYDARGDTLTFTHLPRETQRRVVFLDPRFIGGEPKSPPVAVASLPADLLADEAGPLHFIFHTGFCCSTLLTRALDIPGVCMGLKEPSVLASFASFWTTGRRTPGAISAVEAALNLLSRPLAVGETQIVKPSIVANHIIPQMLAARRDAKALVLCTSLDGFLRAIARRGQEGRSFAREVFQQFAGVIPLDTGIRDEDLLLLTDLQVAALGWLMQAEFMQQVAKRHGAGRVRIVNSDTFLDDKAGVLAALGDFFGLACDGPRWAETAESPVFREHAKEYGRAFDAASQRAQYEAVGAAHAEELMKAKDWARAVALRCGAPLALSDTLI
jgi:hypothetical protein